jgi:phospholipid/cholesterol/gamma-HCH transport system substrate-binding protein
MKRTIKVKWGELKVGLLIVFAIVILLWASFSGGGTSIFDRKVKYTGYIDNANGLVTGAPVWIAGVEVGNVYSMQFIDVDSISRIEIKLRVKRSISRMITTDASMRLGKIGLLGDKYIEIVPGTLTLPPIEEGGVIQTKLGGDLSAVLTEGQDAVIHTKEMIKNLDDITARIKRGEGSIGRMFTEDELYVEITGLIKSMTVLVDGMQTNQERLFSSIENMSGTVDDLADKIDSKAGTVGKLIGDPALYDELHASTARIDTILAKINDGQGTAGAIVNDDELYDNLKNLIVRIDNLVADIEQNPRKYFKFSVF